MFDALIAAGHRRDDLIDYSLAEIRLYLDAAARREADAMMRAAIAAQGSETQLRKTYREMTTKRDGHQ